MAPPSTFFTLVITRDIFKDPDPFVNSYFALNFDLRGYLAVSDIFDVVKLGLEKMIGLKKLHIVFFLLLCCWTRTESRLN